MFKNIELLAQASPSLSSQPSSLLPKQSMGGVASSSSSTTTATKNNSPSLGKRQSSQQIIMNGQQQQKPSSSSSSSSASSASRNSPIPSKKSFDGGIINGNNNSQGSSSNGAKNAITEKPTPFRVAFTKHMYEEAVPMPIELPAWIIELKVQIMNGKKFKIKANQFDNVSELKKTIMEMYAIPLNHQHLFYNCKLLEENHTLVYYEVENGVTLKMNLGETIERCDFYCIRSDLLDENAEQLEFGFQPEDLLSLCQLGKNRPASRPDVRLTIQILNGRSFTVSTSTLDMVGKLKEAIAEQEKIPIEHQHLFYNCQMLNSSRTLICYKIGEGCTITMNLGMSMTGCRFYYVRPDLFDMQYSCDYINTNLQNQTVMFCAGKPYIRPIEARRFAIKVRGKYENNKWLGQPSTSNRIIPDEWPMAYHGTSEANILEIVKSGFDLRKCIRMAYGKGIYCSPDPNTALMYSGDYQCEINKTGTYRVILQCRANPHNLKVVKTADSHQGEYWTVPDGADLRPYGVCVYFYPNEYHHNLSYSRSTVGTNITGTGRPAPSAFVSTGGTRTTPFLNTQTTQRP